MRDMEETPGQKQSNGMMVGIVTLIALIVIGGVGYKLYNHIMSLQTKPAESTVVTKSSPTSEMAVTPSQEASNSAMTNEVTLTITGKNFSFDPKEIKVKQGQKVTVIFENANGMHDFVLDEFNVKSGRIASGGNAKVSFVPSKKGSFEYYCSVGNHRQMGMVGTMIVE